MKTLLLLLFISSCSHVFYQPTRYLYADPKNFKLEFQDIYFQSHDNTQLNGWFFPATAQPAKGTVILFHGNAQNLSSHYLNLVWIVRQGYNLFVFDYRGYGASEGNPNQEDVYYDALAALEKGRELNSRNGNGLYIVYGQSLGGIISLRALADYKYLSQVDLIVQDSTFSTYKGIAFDRLTSRWFLLPFSPLAYLLVSDEYASYKVFKEIKRPLLVIEGMKDFIIPAEFGDQIYHGVASKKKWIWKLEEGRHIDVFHGKQEPYREKFLTLLDEVSRE